MSGRWLLTCYAAWTGTLTTRRALRLAGWRALISPIYMPKFAGHPTYDNGCLVPYMLDNGAWTAHINNQPFDETAFFRAVDRWGDRADWVVLPDIVGGGMSSLELSLSYIDRLAGVPLMLAVQDGITPDNIGALPSQVGGLFVGGTTAWKLAHAGTWAAYAQAHDLWCHVGRVNTMRRIALCQSVGADSCDGSGVTRFPVTLDRLNDQRTTTQQRLFHDRPRMTP